MFANITYGGVKAIVGKLGTFLLWLPLIIPFIIVYACTAVLLRLCFTLVRSPEVIVIWPLRLLLAIPTFAVFAAERMIWDLWAEFAGNLFENLDFWSAAARYEVLDNGNATTLSPVPVPLSVSDRPPASSQVVATAISMVVSSLATVLVLRRQGV